MIPLFLMVVFVILEASLWVYASAVAQAAAQDGVRAGTAYGGSTGEGVRVAERILWARDTGTGWVVTTTGDATTLTLSIAGNAPSVIPGFALTVRESATLPWEVR